MKNAFPERQADQLGVNIERRKLASFVAASLGAMALGGCADPKSAEGAVRASALALASPAGGGIFLWADTIADLRSLIGSDSSPASEAKPVAVVGGYYAPGDGGGGVFYWDDTASTGDDGGVVIVPTGSTTGRWLRLYDGSTFSVKWFGARGDGQTDDALAFQRAFASMPKPNGRTLIIPAGVYVVSQPIRPHRTCVIRGAGGYREALATIINPLPGVVGIWIDGQYNEDLTPTDRADGSCVEFLRIQYNNSPANGVPAIRLRATAILRHINIEGSGGVGIDAYATIDPLTHIGNSVSGSRFEDILIQLTRSHGIHIRGADANACLGIRIEVQDCPFPTAPASSEETYGILDESFLGNTWLACMFHGCGGARGPGGAFKAVAPVGHAMFRDCYVEGGCGPSPVTPPNRVIDGLINAPVTGGGYQINGKRMESHSVDVLRTYYAGSTITMGIGPNEGAGRMLSFTRAGEAHPSVAFAMRNGLINNAAGTTGDWLGWEYQNTNYFGMLLPFHDATLNGVRPCPVFPEGAALGYRGVRIIATDGQPHEGSWVAGTIAFNNWVDDRSHDPNSLPWQGGLMWRCTQTGTYGTLTPPIWQCVLRIATP